MSDFGELCPLFSTGVFKEVLFPQLEMTTLTGTASVYGNALAGTLTFTKEGYFTFGRTVVVTGAFVRRIVTSDSGGIQKLVLLHAASGMASLVVIGTVGISVTADGINAMTWIPMTVTEKTFTSSEVLGFCMMTGTILSAGTYDLMVRYKEK